jgi:hypothetical protein
MCIIDCEYSKIHHSKLFSPGIKKFIFIAVFFVNFNVCILTAYLFIVKPDCFPFQLTDM